MNGWSSDPGQAVDHRRCDVLVVGGGINGAGLARDLAGRGVSVILAEQDDLASHTSSSSTKLIHGGLRYLEYYEFGLVRKALAEREVLLRSAPHIMWPLRFVMPHDPAMRPAWMIRAGLFLYDHLARRDLLPDSCSVDLRNHPAGEPLQPKYLRGFMYSDGWVDDARLVVLLARDAASLGARVLTRCRVETVQRHDALWTARLRHVDARVESVSARVLVNATGPWASQFLADCAQWPRPRHLRLIKGSHLVVPKLFDHDDAYIFQNADRRIIFAIPYEQRFTLIGTTDVEYRGAIGQVQIDASEIDYLCDQASRYFRQPIAPADVVWSYSGVRPLLDEGDGASASALSRDYELELDHQGGAALLSIWGGKITTFRKLSEEAADRVCEAMGEMRPAWTSAGVLPGGDFSAWGDPDALQPQGRALLVQEAARRYPLTPPAVLERWLRSYGSAIDALLAGGSLGFEVAPGLFEAELHYLHRQEWARCADDVLWRRSKLGLHLNAAERESVARWCEQHWGALVTAPVVSRTE